MRLLHCIAQNSPIYSQLPTHPCFDRPLSRLLMLFAIRRRKVLVRPLRRRDETRVSAMALKPFCSNGKPNKTKISSSKWRRQSAAGFRQSYLKSKWRTAANRMNHWEECSKWFPEWPACVAAGFGVKQQPPAVDPFRVTAKRSCPNRPRSWARRN